MALIAPWGNLRAQKLGQLGVAIFDQLGHVVAARAARKARVRSRGYGRGSLRGWTSPTMAPRGLRVEEATRTCEGSNRHRADRAADIGQVRLMEYVPDEQRHGRDENAVHDAVGG